MRLVISALFICIAIASGALAEQLHVIANTTPPDAFLSLRTHPSSQIGQRIAVMTNGTIVQVLQQNPDGWWKVRVTSTGQEGWALSGHDGKVWITATSDQNQAASPSSSGPSFDCTKATAAPARLICADAELSALDRKLGEPFKGILSGLVGGDRDNVIKEQRQWINERNHKCGLVGLNAAPIEQLKSAKPCMVASLRERTVYLTQKYNGLANSMTPPEKTATAASPAGSNSRNVLSKISLRSGEYIMADTPCDQGSNATRLTFDGRQFTGGRGYCVEVDGQSAGLTVKVKPCRMSSAEDAEPSGREEVFSIKSPTAFSTGLGGSYRWCEGAPGATAASPSPQPQARSKAASTSGAGQTFLQTAPESDFVILGPEGGAFRGMFQTLSIRVPSNAMSGRLYCRQKDDRYGGGLATIISINNEERNIPIYANSYVLRELLGNLKEAAINECDRAVTERKLLDFDAKRPVDTLPQTIVVQSTQPCFFASSSRTADTWTTFQNCVVDQQAKARAEEAERQRIASNIATEKLNRANQAARAVFEARKQYGPSLESSEGREFIQPVINYLRSRRYEGGPLVFECDKMIDFAGGAVLGRSIDGNVGVILISLVGINKGDIPLGPGGITASLCGPSSPEANPGEIVKIQVQGIFRKYDTGWRLEQVVTR
jgi:uncharacterized protein YecT (DUF1311 family)